MMVQIEFKDDEKRGNRRGKGRERETQRRGWTLLACLHTRAEENSLSVKTEKPLIQIPISPGRLVALSLAERR